MKHYIDKSALVAEIERKRDICKKVVWDLRSQENKDYYQGKAEAYKETINLLDTLEVKEVDFDAEWKRYFEYRGEMATVNVKHLAKHGMLVSNKAQKGEL